MYLEAHRTAIAASPSPWHDPAAPIDPRPTLLLVAPERALPELSAIAEGAGFRIASSMAPAEVGRCIDYVVGADALLLDLRGLTDGDAVLYGAMRAVRGWPAIADSRLLTCVDMSALEPVLADFDPDLAGLLCDPSLADIATALCLAARHRPVYGQLHDIGRDEDSARLEQLSAEVRRLAQTIERLARNDAADGPASSGQYSLREPVLSYTSAPPPRPVEPRGSGAALTRQEVRGLLQARRLRDRYLPPDLFADPAWDMILDLMAARLDGKRVSVSSLCIAAAVPPTTALRWIAQLTERGICARNNDPEDARRVFITLSEETAENLAAWFVAARRGGIRFSG